MRPGGFGRVAVARVADQAALVPPRPQVGEQAAARRVVGDGNADGQPQEKGFAGVERACRLAGATFLERLELRLEFRRAGAAGGVQEERPVLEGVPKGRKTR